MQAYTAPWQSLSPLSFVEAAKAGAALGQQIKENADRTSLGYYGINSENNRAAAALAAQQSMFSQRQQQDQQELDAKTAAQQLEAQIAREKMLQEAGLEGRKLDIAESGDAAQAKIIADRIAAERDRTAALNKPKPVGYSESTQTIPAVEGQPADVTSHWLKNLFGANLPPTTNAPAILASPERKIVTRNPIYADAQNPVSAAAQLESAKPVIPMLNGVPIQKDTSNFIGDPNGANQLEVDVPDVSKRVVGKTYVLPTGSFVWQGSGWIPAQ